MTKIFDLTESNSANGKANSDCDSEQPLPFESMQTTGTNCHQCLELFWGSELVPRCVCFKPNHQHDE